MSAIASANVEPDVNYENGSQSIDMIETSKGHILITQAEFDFDAWAKHYTIVRYSSDGSELGKLSLGLGEHYFAEYNGKAYILFIEFEGSTLKVYDETFKLVKEQSFSHLNGSDIAFEHVENELVYLFNYTNSDIYTFSLKTLEIVPTTLTVKGATVTELDGQSTLITYDQFGSALSRIPVTGKQLDAANYSGDAFINDALYIARANEDVVEVAKVNLDGEIISVAPVKLPNGTPVNSVYLNAISMDEKILFYNESYDPTEEVIVFIYNTKTEEVVYVDIKNGMPKYEYYGNDKLREFTFGPNGATTFYNRNFDKLYTLDIEEGASLVYPGGDYLIVNDQTVKASRSILYNITTGKPIRTLYTSENLYNPIGVAEAFLFDSNTAIYYVVQEPSYDMIANDAKGYFTKVVSKGNANEISPTARVVAPTKVWTATLTQEVDPASVTNKTVVVTNTKGEQIVVVVKAEGKKIIITPPANNYEVGNYTLTLKDLKSASGKTLKKATTIEFTVK